MPVEAFNDILKRADERMKRLHHLAGSPPTHQHGLVPETFEELQLALEELHVASEELRQQNEVLGDTQAKLATERYRYADLFDNAPDPYFVTDLAGIILESNTAAAELVNVTRKYVVGKPLANYVAPMDKQRFRGYVSRLSVTSEVEHWTLEIKPRHLDTVIPVVLSASSTRNARLEVTGLRWIMRDATILQRVEEEKAARASAEYERAQLSILIDHSSDPMFVVDTFWTVTIANKRCLEAWRTDRDEAIGSSLWELFPALFRSETGRLLRASADEHAAGYFRAISFVEAGHWLEMHLHPLSSGLSVYFRDITQRLEQEELLELANVRDRSIAETLQHSMLVKPHPKELPGLEIGMAYQAAWEDALVGGDYYDAFRIGGEPKIALVVGDVTDKGLTAASYTAQMKYALRAFIWETRAPGAAMARLNDFICAQQIDHTGGNESFGRLVALSIAVLNTDTGEIKIANAGGPSVMILAQDGSSQVCEVRGLLIGVMPDQIYEEATCRLEPGERVLMTTDGVAEARSKDGQILSAEGLQEISRTIPRELPVQEMAAHLLEQIRNFSGAQLHDDICVLIARRTRPA